MDDSIPVYSFKSLCKFDKNLNFQVNESCLFLGYHAPLDVYPELSNLVVPYDSNTKPMFHPDKKVNLCIGREWYRYPSSFFLPEK